MFAENKICLFYERLISALFPRPGRIPFSPLPSSSTHRLIASFVAVTCPRFILCSLKINYRRLFGLSVRCHLFLGFTTFVNILSKFTRYRFWPAPQVVADFAQIFCKIRFGFRCLCRWFLCIFEGETVNYLPGTSMSSTSNSSQWTQRLLSIWTRLRCLLPNHDIVLPLLLSLIPLDICVRGASFGCQLLCGNNAIGIVDILCICFIRVYKKPSFYYICLFYWTPTTSFGRTVFIYM